MLLKRLPRPTALAAFTLLSTVLLTPALPTVRAFAAEPPNAVDSSERKDARLGIAVMNLQTTVSVSTALHGQFENKIRTELLKQKRLRIVARESLPQAIQQIKLSDDGLIDPKQRQALGQVTAANYLVFPRLTKCERHDATYSVSVGLKIVTVTTNVENFVELEGTYTAEAPSTNSGKKNSGWTNILLKAGGLGSSGNANASPEESALQDALSGAGKKVLAALNLQDNVAGEQYTIIDVNRQDNTFMIDTGKGGGIVDGMELNVYTVSKRTLSTGREYTKKTLIGVARVIHSDDDAAQLQIGVVKQEGNFLSKHPVWHLDTEKMAQVNEKCIAMLSNEVK